jgi:hypothetical protein
MCRSGRPAASNKGGSIDGRGSSNGTLGGTTGRDASIAARDSLGSTRLGVMASFGPSASLRHAGSEGREDRGQNSTGTSRSGTGKMLGSFTSVVAAAVLREGSFSAASSVRHREEGNGGMQVGVCTFC